MNKEYNMVGAPEHEAVETWGGLQGCEEAGTLLSRKLLSWEWGGKE